MSCSKADFAQTIAELDNTLSHATMSECESYGMTWGCDVDCPVLREGLCELKDAENKELYEQVLKERE